MPPQSDLLGFTSDLLEAISLSKQAVDAYVGREKKKCDGIIALHQKSLQAEQRAIDDRAETLLSVQLERGLSLEEKIPDGLAQRRQDLLNEKDQLEHTKCKLGEDLSVLKEQNQGLIHQQSIQKAKALEARDLRDRIEEAKKTTVDDLTRGIVNYTHLGLDFEKAENGSLKFNFIHLDAGEPLRPFSFILNVTDSDTYEVCGCDPVLPNETISGLVDDLNKFDDLSAFVRGMRLAFSKGV